MTTVVRKIVHGAIAAAVVASIAGVSQTAQAKRGDMEKCYGVAKAGKNDCGTATHACAGQAKRDGDPKEWIYLPKGACSKIVGGNTG